LSEADFMKMLKTPSPKMATELGFEIERKPTGKQGKP